MQQRGAAAAAHALHGVLSGRVGGRGARAVECRARATPLAHGQARRGVWHVAAARRHLDFVSLAAILCFTMVSTFIAFVLSGSQFLDGGWPYAPSSFGIHVM